METTTETAIEKLESKIKDCNNDTTIFSTKKYVLFDDAKKILIEQSTSQKETIDRLREFINWAINQDDFGSISGRTQFMGKAKQLLK